MPSRKSDVRRSDVSAVSRPIAPAHDEDSPMTAAPAETDSAGPATGPTLAPPVVPSFETPLAAESNAGTSEKGKEKDKERERDRDALGIEVRLLSSLMCLCLGRWMRAEAHYARSQGERRLTGRNSFPTGSQPAQIDHHSAGQGRASA